MKGQCVCGATTFTVELKNHDVHACHCSICRRQTSGVIMTIDVEQGSLKFTQDDHLSIYNSSEWGERGFCNCCGTNLFLADQRPKLLQYQCICSGSTASRTKI